MNHREIQAAFAEKIERGIFNAVRRVAPDEDRFAEGVGMAWATYAENARRGRELSDAILVAHCRRRAADPGRRLAGGVRKRDVLDVRNQIEQRVFVTELDAGMAVDDGANPTRRLNSALDLAAWLDGLEDRDQGMLAMRAAGDGLAEIGRAVERSTAWCCTRIRALGMELAERAGILVEGVS